MQIYYKNKGLLAVKGQITLENIQDLRKLGEQAIKEQQQMCRISFLEVYYVHLSAVSLITSWARFAKQHNKNIEFIELPDKLANWLKIINMSTAIKSE